MRRSRVGRSKGCQGCRPGGRRNNDSKILLLVLKKKNKGFTWQLRSCMRASVCRLSCPIRQTVDSSTTDQIVSFFIDDKSSKN